MTRYGRDKFGWDLPPGVRESDIPGWDDPDPISCENCGEDVYPDERCVHCGTVAIDPGEAAAEAELERAAEEAEEARLQYEEEERGL